MEMNRREALQTGLSVLSALSIDGEVATLSPSDPQAFVLSIPRGAPQSQIDQVRTNWMLAFHDSPLAKIPVIILADGMTLQVIDNPKPAAESTFGPPSPHRSNQFYH